MSRINKQIKIAFISSYVPRKCGIATFTSDLIRSISSAAGLNYRPSVFALRNGEQCGYSEPVEFTVRQDIKSDYLEACDCINSGGFDAVSVQHEFGLFGGDGGSFINLLLKRLKVPVFTTLHTVLEKPEPHYFNSLIDVCDNSSKVIVMNKRGIDMLTDIYGVHKRKIELIPHGIPDIPFNHISFYKRKLGLQGRKVILTFGLIGPNKGIEVMLNALPAVVKYHPEALYVILGAIHPGVVKHQGYEYKNKLLNLINSSGLQDNVLYLDRFATNRELCEYLAAADIYITPYLYEQQLTSGTLAFAVGAGKAVVSTPYWAAQELLADDRGVLVPFGDSEKIAEEIVKLFKNELLLHQIQTRAYLYGRTIIWPKVGKAYWRLLERELSPECVPLEQQIQNRSHSSLSYRQQWKYQPA
jgi:glycosyltransferase involved in cell wall biosynthesis